MTKILFDKMFDKSESDTPKSSDMDRTVGIYKHKCENISVSGPSSLANQSKKKKKKSNNNEVKSKEHEQQKTLSTNELAPINVFGGNIQSNAILSNMFKELNKQGDPNDKIQTNVIKFKSQFDHVYEEFEPKTERVYINPESSFINSLKNLTRAA